MGAGADEFATREEAFEAAENVPSNPDLDRTFGSVLMRRFSRRGIVAGLLAVPVAEALFTGNHSPAQAETARGFTEVKSGLDDKLHIADGHEAQVVLAWGDPLAAGLPPFDPTKLTADDQRRRFGYNNDYLAFFPLDATGTRGLLCVNHEYTSPELMFPGVGRPDRQSDTGPMDKAKVDIEIAAHGCSVVEIALTNGHWKPVVDSPRNRRITADTPMTTDGPAAGHPRLKTKADPTGRRILGTFNNCGGGQTPWGTYLTAEENFNGYFMTGRRELLTGRRLTRGLGGPNEARNERYAVPSNWYNWGQFHDRFDVDKEPNEANRFGWIVEFDPRDPTSTPIKHTALGRFRHECAEIHVNGDGRIVTYMGDDSTFEYLYRYVSNGRFDPADPVGNVRLLSDGVLSVARFDPNGTGTWLPLVFGEGPLTPANGFADQGDVVIDARLAGDLLKATSMDRPEDVQVHPRTGKVMVMLTNNGDRKAAQVNAANPRAQNAHGHIVELTPTDGDHGAPTFRWDSLIKCGDPRVAAVGALWNPATSEHGWFSAPDNVAFDADGRMWVATDQAAASVRRNRADGLFHIETEGAARGTSKLFLRAPIGAEICGPCFTPDGETLFVAIQHPGVDGARDWKPFGRDPRYEDPPTRWPDFKPDMPPRPAVIAIRRKRGGRIA